MKSTSILTNSIFMNIDMNWQNVQHMDLKERKQLINKVISIDTTNSCFIHYGAKYHLANIIHYSECYFNVTRKSTKVKEFDILGWYNEQGKLDFNKINA